MGSSVGLCCVGKWPDTPHYRSDQVSHLDATLMPNSLSKTVDILLPFRPVNCGPHRITLPVNLFLRCVQNTLFNEGPMKRINRPAASFHVVTTPMQAASFYMKYNYESFIPCLYILVYGWYETGNARAGPWKFAAQSLPSRFFVCLYDDEQTLFLSQTIELI